MGLPDEAKEELLQQGKEMEDVTSNPQHHLIKEEPVELTSRLELEERKAVEMIKEEVPQWDEFTPSKVEEPGEFTSRPELEELKAV